MVTRQQTDHLRPRTILDLAHNIMMSKEPTSHLTALKQPLWHAAMLAEFQALTSMNS